MQNIKTAYVKQLFENLRNGKYNFKTNRQYETDKFFFGKEVEKTKKDFDVKKIITSLEKGKKCLPAAKNRSDILSLKELKEVCKNFVYKTSQGAKITFKLDNVFDIFYSVSIPPIIKSKRNVIVLIENDNLKKKNKRKSPCPDCLKEQAYQKLIEKISSNLKQAILLIRKKLLRKLSKNEQEVVPVVKKPGFLILDDALAPFPELDTDAIPVFSFTEDKPPMRRECKTEPDRNEPSNKNCHDPISEELFYQWKPKQSVTDDTSKCDSEKITPTEGDEGSFQQNEANINCPTEIAYSKNSVQVIPKYQPQKNIEPFFENKSKNPKTENDLNGRNLKKNRRNVFIEQVANDPSNIFCTSAYLDVSEPNVAILPMFKTKQNGKRNITIKLINVPEHVDVIKIKSIISNIYNDCQNKNNSKYFLKNNSKPRPCNGKPDTTSDRQKYSMTSPNKDPKATPKLFEPRFYIPESSVYRSGDPRRSFERLRQNNVRYRENDYFEHDE